MMELLRAGARALGLNLSPGHLELFELYYRELSVWNQRFNLTAITRYEDVQVKHFLDSLSCLLALSPWNPGKLVPDTVPLHLDSHSLWCLDVGSGAGLPGIPIKIMLPDAHMTLIEATRKKADFLRHMVEILSLQNVEVIHARAEHVAHLPEHRERYDVVLARAVAHLRILAEYCLPFCRPGGRLIAPKGEDAADEAEESGVALQSLGGALLEVKSLVLPGLAPERYLIVVDKVGRTPEAYPRRPGIPSKRPLG